MNHQLNKENISLLIDNELSPQQQKDLFLHLAECDDCRIFFLHAASIRTAAGRLAAEIVPDGLDRKFSVLAMEEKKNIFKSTTVTLSLQSILYSIGAAIMMTLFVYVAGSIQEESLSQQYIQSIHVTAQQNEFSVERN